MRRSITTLLLTIPLLISPLFGQTEAQLATAAEVDGERISLQDLKEAAGEPLATLEEQAYRLKQQKLQQMIEDRLLVHEAHRRNVSLQWLIDAEITSKVPEVSSEEVHRVYELNKTQLLKPESAVEGQLRSFLRKHKIAARQEEYAKFLQARATVSIYLLPPPPFRVDVHSEGPSRGPADAPVTIIEFEDFQCPFCRKAQDTLEQVVLHYKDKIRIVHRDFPLEQLHPASWKAHEAGRCAEEQGRFWEYRSLLYRNAPAASQEQLKGYAAKLALNVSDFEKCLDSGKFSAVVKKDADEGNRLGVEGTPAFFINGRRLSGAQPESEFARIIDEELSKRAQR
jgi:protein-disulfide isomerase